MKAKIVGIDTTGPVPLYSVDTGGQIRHGVPGAALKTTPRAAYPAALHGAIADAVAKATEAVRAEAKTDQAALRAEIEHTRRSLGDLVGLLAQSSAREASLTALVERISGQIPAAVSASSAQIAAAMASLEASVRAPQSISVMRDAGQISSMVVQRDPRQ